MDIRQDTNIAVELALLVALATLWGGSYTFIKLGVATIPPVTLIAARTTVAGLLLLAVMCARGVSMPTDAATWQRFAFQAVLNSVIPWTLIAWGERHVDAALATILNSAGPIFTFLLTAVVTRHEATTPRKLFGVVAGMAGILLIVGVDPEFARKAGFPRPILHGMCTYGITCRGVLQTYADYDASAFRQHVARFSSPVYPGETVTMDLWKDGNVISFEAKVKSRGVTVIKNGKTVLG